MYKLAEKSVPSLWMPKGCPPPRSQTLNRGQCRRAVGSWFAFCKCGERGWKWCWALADAFPLGAADAPDESQGGHWGRLGWAGGQGSSLGQW